MNNKGQSLVIFVLTLPLIFIMLTILFDLGNLLVTQNKIESDIKKIITYALKNPEKSEEELKQITDFNINIIKEDNLIKVNIKKEYEPLYKIVLRNKAIIDITYTGKIENEKIIINKE